jgi:pimeloyl-ACP methyl ester carboxylesterase
VHKLAYAWRRMPGRIGGAMERDVSSVHAPTARERVWAVALLGIAVIAVVGCGGEKSTSSARSASEPTPTASPPPAPPAERCGTPGPRARVVTFDTRDGVVLDGVEVGAGRAGVVLLHMSPTDLCDWWPFARDFARRGVHALMIDLRCAGSSGCPQDLDKITEPTADVEAAAAELRARGARRVTVVGASAGGASALVAAAHLHAGVDGVASLSAVPHFEDALNVPAIIGALSAPLLMSVEPADDTVSVAETRAMFSRAGSRRKALLLRPRGSGHGTALLLAADGSPSVVFSALVRFIHTGELPDGL